MIKIEIHEKWKFTLSNNVNIGFLLRNQIWEEIYNVHAFTPLSQRMELNASQKSSEDQKMIFQPRTGFQSQINDKKSSSKGRLGTRKRRQKELNELIRAFGSTSRRSHKAGTNRLKPSGVFHIFPD